MKNYKTWSLLIIGFLIVCGAFSLASLIQAQTVSSKITSIVSSTGAVGEVSPGGWVKVRGAGLSNVVSIPGTSYGPLSVSVSDAGQRVDFKIDIRETPGNYQVSVRGSDGKNNSISLKILGSTPAVEKSVANISFDSWSPNTLDWQAGTSKNFQVSYSGLGSNVGISFELCKPDTATCVGFGSNASISGSSGNMSVSRELGAQGDNTLYARLENGDNPPLLYYNRVRDAVLNKNVYEFKIKTCAVSSSGVKSNCGVFYRTFRVIPYGGTPAGTWSAWSSCNTTTCQTQTRTCSPTGASCSGESSRPCEFCSTLSPQVAVQSSAEASGGSIGGSATVSWTAQNTGYCSATSITGVTGWPPSTWVIPGTSRRTIGLSDDTTVNFTTAGTKNFTVTCGPLSGGTTVNDTASVVVANPVNGGWGSWGPCSTNSCTTMGQQTRSCNNPAPTGGGVCLDDAEGGASRFCYGATCSDPKIDTINNGSSLGNLPAGVSKVIPYTYKNFSSTVSKAQISICKTTSGPCQVVSTSEGPFVVVPNGSTSTVKSLGVSDGRLYNRLVNGFSGTNSDTPLTVYYTNHTTYFSAYYKICPYNSNTGQALANCKYASFNLIANPNALRDGGWSAWDNSNCSYPTCHDQARLCNNPAPANGGATCSGDSVRRCPALDCQLVGPQVKNVSLKNIYNVNISDLNPAGVWPSGQTLNVGWDYSGFGQDSSLKTYVKTVSLSICNIAGTSCYTWSGAAADSLIASYSGPGNGMQPNVVQSITLPKATGALLYSRLASSTVPRTGLLSVFTANKPYQAKIKICPTYSAGAPSGYNISSGTSVYPAGTNLDNRFCSFSQVFELVDPNDSNSPTFGLPSGQGCFVGECVCVGGVTKVCGNPMRPGGSCTIAGCARDTSASIPGRLMASLGNISSWLLGLLGLNK